MSSEVDICNLSLARLGDEATVASIDPPEGSSQAAHCARFYPMARDTIQDMHNWWFCINRDSLALLNVTPAFGWQYAYSVPTDLVSMLGVFIPGSADDFSPQEYELEALADGTQVVYTNVQDAVCKYVSRETDTAKFQPLFTDALAWLLASMLAGPILKGEAGQQAGLSAYKMFRTVLAEAITSDANQRKINPTHRPDWIKDRNPTQSQVYSMVNPWAGY
jgi:hypothetical protein